MYLFIDIYCTVVGKTFRIGDHECLRNELIRLLVVTFARIFVQILNILQATMFINRTVSQLLVNPNGDNMLF